MKKSYVFILFLLFGVKGFCCINEYGVDAHGHEHMLENYKIRFKPFDKKEIKHKLKSLEKKLQNNYSFKDHSDYAVNLLKIGHTKSALGILQSLIILHPKEYNIASNLGTAYELAGKNDSALKYIKLGMVLNPYSHHESEWVHKRILEVKLKYSSSLKSSFKIIEIDTTNNCSVEKKCSQVKYQLQERMPFTPLGDTLLSKILEEMGNYHANHLSLNRSILYFKMAKLYNPNNTLAINSKILRAEKLLTQFSLKERKGAERKTRYERIILKRLKYHTPLFVKYEPKWFAAY